MDIDVGLHCKLLWKNPENFNEGVSAKDSGRVIVESVVGLTEKCRAWLLCNYDIDVEVIWYELIPSGARATGGNIKDMTRVVNCVNSGL